MPVYSVIMDLRKIQESGGLATFAFMIEIIYVDLIHSLCYYFVTYPKAI